jgi:hypothetical protein
MQSVFIRFLSFIFITMVSVLLSLGVVLLLAGVQSVPHGRETSPFELISRSQFRRMSGEEELK